jgi:3-oxoacyl-[acyl-carrier-protein] synthase-3
MTTYRSKETDMPKATITGWGKCVPPAVITNADYETVMDTSDEWITSRTGIKERRITHVENSDMAAVAGDHALAAAGLAAADIDLLILATCTPDRIIPGAAAYVQAKLGLENAAAMDINAACSGFVYALTLGSSMIQSGMYQRILVIGSEKLSMMLSFEDRSTAVLFGDGAGAVVIEPTTGTGGILSTDLGTDGKLVDALTAGGYGTAENLAVEEDGRVQMDGREIFRNAVVQMGEAAVRVAEEAGWGIDGVDMLIPHQANVRIIDATARRMKLPPEKAFVNIASYGNTSAASIPIALTEALEEGRINPGDHIVFVAFGGGLTWAAAALEWGERVTPISTSDARLSEPTETGIELLKRRNDVRVRSLLD